jgi:uncharacterized SAM-binding protein YcdF (DUF218 family)
MFFELSKVLGFFALPSNALIALGLIGAVLMATRFARAGRRLAVISLGLLATVGLLPVGSLLLYVLENRFPPWDPALGAPHGIIVLGGAIDPDRSAAKGKPVLDNGQERMTEGAELALRYPKARLVFTGGSGSLFSDKSEGDYAVAAFEQLGVPRERIEVEGRSRNTAENASFTAAQVAPKPGERWVLVTSASHMPRAMGVFRAIDFQVEPYPVDRRVLWVDLFYLSRSLSGGLSRTDAALKELAGLVMYRLTGRSSELFPGPANLVVAGRGDRRP